MATQNHHESNYSQDSFIEKSIWLDGSLTLKKQQEKKNCRNPLSPVWKYFFQSSMKNCVTKCSQAKCRFCGIKLEGKVEMLFQHLESFCKLIFICDKTEMLQLRVLKKPRYCAPG